MKHTCAAVPAQGILTHRIAKHAEWLACRTGYKPPVAASLSRRRDHSARYPRPYCPSVTDFFPRDRPPPDARWLAPGRPASAAGHQVMSTRTSLPSSEKYASTASMCKRGFFTTKRLSAADPGTPPRVGQIPGSRNGSAKVEPRSDVLSSIAGSCDMCLDRCEPRMRRESAHRRFRVGWRLRGAPMARCHRRPR